MPVVRAASMAMSYPTSACRSTPMRVVGENPLQPLRRLVGASCDDDDAGVNHLPIPTPPPW